MKVGVPTEIKTDEYRVALTPAGVRELVENGHEVFIQAGAGEGSAIADEEHREESDGPCERGQEVDVLHERAAADGCRERGEVEDEPRAEQNEKRRRVHPVHRALRPREPPDVPRALHAAFERPIQASRS